MAGHGVSPRSRSARTNRGNIKLGNMKESRRPGQRPHLKHRRLLRPIEEVLGEPMEGSFRQDDTDASTSNSHRERGKDSNNTASHTFSLSGLEEREFLSRMLVT